jgi:hypothetical protein
MMSFAELEDYEVRTKWIIPKLQKAGYDKSLNNLVPYYYLKVFSEPYQVSGWGGYPVPTSRNLYRIVQGLDMYVVKNDSIYYSSGYIHSDTLVQENNIPYIFNFEPEVLDSLISLTMKKYINRLK